MRLVKQLLMLSLCVMLGFTYVSMASDPASKAMDMAKDKAMKDASDMAKDKAMDAAAEGMGDKVPPVDAAKPEVPPIPGTDDVTDMAKDAAMDAAKEEGEKMMKDAAEDQVKKLAQ